jgi:hypothetical protein
MELPDISQDDLMDVLEMTRKMEEYISTVLSDNDRQLSISALMSASINCMLENCKTLDEVIFYRNIFIQILDNSIRHIQIKGHETTS